MKVYNVKKKNNKRLIMLFVLITLAFFILLFLKLKLNVTENNNNIYKPNKSYSKTSSYKEIEEKEQKFINNFKETKFEEIDSTLVFEDPSTGVILPIYYTPDNDVERQNETLSKGLITQQSVSKPGEGNFVIFGHNDYFGGYLTPEVQSLKVDDEIFIYKKNFSSKYTKYTFKIKKKEIVNKNEVHKVYYKTSKPVINIGTCQYWYKTPNRIIWSGELIEKEEIEEK